MEERKLIVSESAIINAPPAKVWEIIRSFDGVERYIPMVLTSEINGNHAGCERRCNIRFGPNQTANLVERLDSIDDNTRTLKYSIIDAPQPFPGLKGTVKVSNREGKSEVVWSGDLQNSDKQASMMLSGIYKMALDGLKKLTED
ncbi:MAG: SRPBCC family protein [Nitrosarchaeum sp.]|nr:MAG: SRPBCC family protein [Nitrosarchaeum sp.]